MFKQIFIQFQLGEDMEGEANQMKGVTDMISQKEDTGELILYQLPATDFEGSFCFLLLLYVFKPCFIRVWFDVLLLCTGYYHLPHTLICFIPNGEEFCIISCLMKLDSLIMHSITSNQNFLVHADSKENCLYKLPTT